MELGFCSLQSEQISDLCRTITMSEPALQELNFWGVNLKLINGTMIGYAIAKLKKVVLTGTGMTSKEMEKVFRVLEKENPLYLEELGLGLMNLGQISEVLLAQTLIKLKRVNIAEAQLTLPQLSQLTESIIEKKGPPVLEALDISGNLVSKVQPQKLAKALAKIEKVNLKYCGVLESQLRAIADEILASIETTALKSLNLQGNSK